MGKTHSTSGPGMPSRPGASRPAQTQWETLERRGPQRDRAQSSPCLTTANHHQVLGDEAMEIYHFLIKLMSTREVYFSTNLLTKVFLKKLPLLKLKYSWEISQGAWSAAWLSCHIQPGAALQPSASCVPSMFMEMSLRSILVVLKPRSAHCPEGETQ